jgi:hypothetical protein
MVESTDVEMADATTAGEKDGKTAEPEVKKDPDLLTIEGL